MPQLFGQRISKEEVLKRVGHLWQLGGVQLQECCSGPARGVQHLEFRTGTGLIFKVAVDRGMDVGYCEFRGRSLAWIPPTQLPAPWFFGEQANFGWLRNALGGLINTCGLVHIGNPASVKVDHFNFPARDVEHIGVHDRIALSPARLLQYGERWDGDDCWLGALGEISQAQPFGENLRLTRRYEAKLGESKFRITDTVENLGYYPTQHMLLYHINFGYPFVQENAEIVIPIRDGKTPKVLVGDVENASQDWHKVIPPTKDWQLQVFKHAMASAKNGKTTVGILQTNPDGDYCEGAFLNYNVNQLPVFIQTRMMGEGFYSIILEPATNGMDAEGIEAAGDRVWLQPGEVRNYALEIGILEDRLACEEWINHHSEMKA